MTTSSHQNRRGMLLLLVMLMLSLFMAIGAWLLTITLRSRSSARAYGNAALATTGADNLAREALDQALVLALRGGTNGSVTTTGTMPALENILADKYGPPLISGSGIVQSGTGTPVLTLALTGAGVGGTANRLGGRILTLAPNPGDGDIASFRILGGMQTGTTGSTAECYIANLPTTVTRKLPTRTSSFTINGREFTPASGTMLPEPYDAYDDANIWLAQPLLALGQVSRFNRLSFSGTAASAAVDNDNDGVLDGVWLPSDTAIATAIASGTSTPAPFVIPDRPSPLGGMLRFQVSYLILDLDGRININAAGMAMPQSASYPADAVGPLGMGYGPADVDASLLFPPSLPTSSTSPFTGSGTAQFSGTGTSQFATTTLTGSITISPTSGTTTTLKWPTLLIGGTTPPANSNPAAYQRRAPVSIGPMLGRYGLDRNPGSPNDDTDILQTSTGTSSYVATVSDTNAFADLQGRRRVFMRPPAPGQITPTLVASSTVTDLRTAVLDEDAKDDPYETRLDGTSNNDSTFSIAELERILRANDPDALQLPQRLAAGLEDTAQISRMTITTDSWDTPALTGLVARRVEDALASGAVAYSGTASAWRSGTTSGTNSISPDVAAGLRFNINRPVVTDNEKQEFCKGLYTLVMLLGATNAQTAAQWAANVMDFRDADSNPTRFDYDLTLSDGWITTGSNVVWGVERPEMVITETAGWADTTSGSSQLFVTLHRPAATMMLVSTSTSTPVSGTATQLNGWQIRFDQNIASSKAVSLVSGSSASSASTPIPQTVVGQPSTFTTTVYSGSSTTTQLSTSGTSGSESYLCVHPVGPAYFSPTGVNTLQVSGSSFALPANVTSGTVTLERLANLSQAHSGTNPYIVVDRAPISVKPATNLQKKRRTGPNDVPDIFPNNLTAFWKNPFTTRGPSSNPIVAWEDAGTTLGQYSITATKPAPWFHWPDRPFISPVELALVPADSASTLLENYAFPSTSLVNDATLGQLLLDAVHVPSRFAGNTLTLTNAAATTASRFGLDLLQSGSAVTALVSKWREPGKVNVNTIVSGTAIPTDNVVWTTLIGGTSISLTTGTVTANPFTPMVSGSLAPADSTRKLLSLSATGTAIATGTFSDLRNSNPYFPYSQAIRLANTATIRSQVFAVWITVKITDDSPNAPSPVMKRMFAIIDRSIPVGYAPGLDLNVRDTIRLKRFLD